jgi:hypothetical protein
VLPFDAHESNRKQRTVLDEDEGVCTGCGCSAADGFGSCRFALVALLLLLLWVWHAEHVSMQESVAGLRSKILEMRTELVSANGDYDRISSRLDFLETKLAASGTVLSADLAAKTSAQLAALAVPRALAQPVYAAPISAGGGACISWRQTGGCISTGAREPDNDKGCDVKIWSIWSGYCECDWGDHKAVGGSCTHPRFTCREACSGGPDWRVPPPPPPPPLGDQPVSRLAELVVPVKFLREADCPAEAREFYQNIPIVYTWVDGSQPDYRKIREQWGGRSAVGGARDRDNGELRFSLRSLERFLPWWRGHIYVVAPKQTPTWINTANPRVHIVDQDELYPTDDRQFLPTFNTNSIEQWLYNIPGMPGEVFMHMNDDYLFAGSIEPQDLFGPSCQGVRVLVENRPVTSCSKEEFQRRLEVRPLQPGTARRQRLCSCPPASDSACNVSDTPSIVAR